MDKKKSKFNLYFGITLGLYLAGALLSYSSHEVQGSAAVINALTNILVWLMRAVSLVSIIIISGLFAIKATSKNYYGWFALLQIIILLELRNWLGETGVFIAFIVCFGVIKFLENKFAKQHLGNNENEGNESNDENIQTNNIKVGSIKSEATTSVDKNKEMTEVKKKRKTLDQYIGINGLGIIALVSEIVGGDLGRTLKPIGTIAAISAVYYLIKKRKGITKNQKMIGWVLVAIWGVMFGIASGSFSNENSIPTNTTQNNNEAETLESALISASNEMNKDLPVMLDKVTQMTSTSASGNELSFSHKILTETKITQDDLDKSLKNGATDKACTTSETKELLDVGAKFVYLYYDNNGKYIGKMSLSSVDCN